MKDLLYEVYIEPFKGNTDSVGIFLSIILWFVSTVIFLLIVFAVLYAYDKYSPSRGFENGIVISKEYIPIRTAVYMMKSGDMTIPITQVQPEQYNLTIETQKGTNSVSVPKEYYNESNKGDFVRVEYSLGKLSGCFYIIKIIGKQ